MEAQELERRRIAWDVHDDSIQAMVAVGMRLQLLAGRLPAEHADVVRRLDEAVGDAIGRLRDLVFRLRPPELDRYGLVEALDRYLADVTGSWEVGYRLRHALDHEPPADAAITVFRICQEAVTNVHKHARATTVEITLSSVDNGTLVEIADDGVGIGELPGRNTSEHFGTVEMRERAETAGGWWSLTDRPGGGALVQFWVPTPVEVER
ncbi:sensor histidine kinase [Saccharothrix xinjiangensis]|uniref:Sensor histidine kinase n=1 Tax=Saccharothrix xinjiangensis TaxID=204798 RepID=A0ABV9XZT7_9PSEU